MRFFKYLFLILLIFTICQTFYYFIKLESFKENINNNEYAVYNAPYFNNLSFVRNSVGCLKEANKYIEKRNSAKFQNYCNKNYKANLPVNYVSQTEIDNFLSFKFPSVNLSSTYLHNRLDKCASFCRNTARIYMILHKDLCYCLEEKGYSKLKLIKIRKNCYSQCLSIFETGVSPLSFIKPSFNKDVGAEVVIVYLLMINGRDVVSFYRLFKIIYSKKDYYFIHIDERQKFLIEYLKKMVYDNVFLFDWSLPTIWGGASLLSAYRRAMETIINMELKWDFLINLSESDYLIQPKKDLDIFLANNKKKNFVRNSGESVVKFIEKQGLTKAFIECDEHLHLLEERSLPQNLVIDGGSDWFVLSYDFVHYLSTSTDLLIDNLFIFFQNSLLPAETFFHTALQNSKFCGTIVNSNLRFTNWNRERGCRCQHSSVIGWCGCSPSVLRIKDFRKLRKLVKRDNSLFFARKFDSVIDSEILDIIDREVHRLNETSCEPKRYSHTLNFYNTLQDNDAYSSLASLLFITAVSNYTEGRNCSWKTVMDDDNSLYLGINNLKSNIDIKNVIVYYNREKVHFEAVMEYIGTAGVQSRISTDIISLHSLHMQLTSLKVSQNYDVKENLFRTPPFLMIATKPLCLELQLKSRWQTQFDFNVVFTNPNSIKYSFHLPNFTSGENRNNQYFDGRKRTHVWFQGFDIPQPYDAGLWEVVIFFDRFRYPLLKNYFYVQPSKNAIVWDSVERFGEWRLKKLCFYSDHSECGSAKRFICEDCLFKKMLAFFIVE